MTKTVYTSRRLGQLFPKVRSAIVKALAKHDIVVEEAGSPANLWCRDYLPIPTSWGLMLFSYQNHPKLPNTFCPEHATAFSPIVLDGGNVVQDNDHVIMTDIVFQQNVKSRADVTTDLERLFKKQLIFIPVEPGDDLGHSDGIVHLCGDGRVLVNDYSQIRLRSFNGYQERLQEILSGAGLEVVRFPNGYHHCPKLTEREFRKKYPMADDFNPAAGYWINFLRVGPAILMPQFGFPDDAWVVSVASLMFPHCTVHPIECFDLSMLGGLLHCVTWTKEI